eukprot:COSAG06_NODE_46956_length_343_cov_0.565574_1_plen_96_part_01
MQGWLLLVLLLALVLVPVLVLILLVQLVLEAGPAAGLYGAKITGGGSGGTVCVLSSAGGEASIRAVAAAYAEKTGHTPHIFRSSSIGGEAFGKRQS